MAWGTCGKVFWSRMQSSGGRQGNDSKIATNRMRLLGTGYGVSLALPLMRCRACSHVCYTNNGYAVITTTSSIAPWVSWGW